MFFNLTNRDGDTTLSIIGAFGQRSIAPVHPNFSRLVEYLTGGGDDEAHVEYLVDPTKAISAAFQDIDTHLTVDLHNVYYMGVPVAGGMADHIMSRVTAGDDWERFARFLSNLEQNPSARAKEAVFKWVEQNGLTITEDGRFLGYKAVQADGKSKHSGPNNFINGVLFGEAGKDYQVPHEVGSVISKRRADVDENDQVACSTGLHVGTEQYAKGFGERLLTVAVNPRDVVSVPDGDLTWKIRVSEYEVISLADVKQFASTSYDLLDKSSLFDDAAMAGIGEDEDYVDQYENPNDVESEEDEYDSEVWNEEDEEQDPAVSNEYFEGEPNTVGEDYTTEQNAQYPRPSSTYAGLTLAQVAEQIPALKADLDNREMGHKPLARKWEKVTTESSVRRYRKSHNG